MFSAPKILVSLCVLRKHCSSGVVVLCVFATPQRKTAVHLRKIVLRRSHLCGTGTPESSSSGF
jgi:hypothetical protein